MIAGAQTRDGDRVTGVATIHHHIAAAGQQGGDIIGDIGIGEGQGTTATGCIKIGLKVAHRVSSSTVDVQSGINHRIRINRHRVIGTTGGDRGGGITGGDTDAVITSISSGDIQTVVEARASEIADKIGDDLFCGTEQSQQGVLAKLGGIGGDRIEAAVGGDRGGAGASCHADGVVGGITGGHIQGAAGISGQQRADEIIDLEVVGVGTATDGEAGVIGKIGRIDGEVVTACGAVHRCGTRAGVNCADTCLAGLATGTEGGGTSEAHRLQSGDIGELAVRNRAGVSEHKGVAIGATIDGVTAGQASDDDIKSVSTCITLQIHISAGAGRDRVGAYAAQHGFKTGNTGGSRRCSGGEVN